MNQLFVILLPAILCTGTVLVMLVEAFVKNPAKKTSWLSIAVLGATIAASIFLWNSHGTAFNGMIVLDSFSLIATFLFSLAAFITLLLIDGTPYNTSQFHALLLLTVVGMILLIAGANFIILFIGLEMLSLSIYVLACFAKHDPLSAESGLKYFLLGSFASAFFLYGIAFIFGATGSLHLNKVAEVIGSQTFQAQPVLYLGLLFLLVGFAFKISLAPFHMWTPDVYEGAPTPVTGFMAATVKAAALASLIRVFLVAFPSAAGFWQPLIWVLASLTMLFGNLTAIWQDNLKRLLAYSSIAHAGYMLTGLLANPSLAQQTILYYFATYVFMNLGAFTVVAYLERSSNFINIGQYRGLAYARPYLAVLMTLFLMSLGGMPPTAGFFGKFYLFRAVLENGQVWAVVIAVLNSAVSFYYYLRVVISMFTPEKETIPVAARVGIPIVLILILTAWGTITLGLFPGFFLGLARAVSIVAL
jgi:NADH-quinone oxidoreductase subunit N